MRQWIVAAAIAAGLVVPVVASGTGGSAARGGGIARALGCTDCHGRTLAGKTMFDNPAVATLWSSNLSRVLPRYSDAQLERVLRAGVRPDGTKLWYMDAAPYAVMTATDMRDLIAWLRTVKPTGVEHPRLKPGPRWAKIVADGLVKPAADTLGEALAKPPAAYGDALDRGRYVARTQCAGCHEPDLRGVREARAGDPPDLAVVAGYPLGAFRTLIRTGKGLGGREVGEMSQASRQRLAGMPDSDVRALHAYLTTWAMRR